MRNLKLSPLLATLLLVLPSNGALADAAGGTSGSRTGNTGITCKQSQGSQILDASATQKAQDVDALVRSNIEQRLDSGKIPNPSYFIVYNGSQGYGNMPRESHTFATYIKASKSSQQWTTISFLPTDFASTKHINVFKDLGEAILQRIFGHAPEPVPGKNYTAKQSWTWAQEAGKSLAVWVPIRITEEKYEAGIARSKDLAAREVKYAADSDKFRTKEENAANCMQAVGDTSTCRMSKGGPFGTGWRVWGIPGTTHVVKEMVKADPDGFLDEVDSTNFWLFKAAQ